MTGPGTVLISGAGVAGAAAAFWLHRYGWDVTVVERSPSLRATGQNVDVRGAGREVVRRMGLEAAIAAHGTGEVGLRFVDGDGRAVAEFPAGADGATADLEILRGHLVALLAGLTDGLVEYRFGDRIVSLDQDGDGVTAGFEGGDRRRFDLVVVAEGVRSPTRRLVFGDQARFRDLGQYTAYGTVPRTALDDNWWRWLSAPGGRAVTLRPDDVGTTRATLSWMGPRLGEVDAGVLREVFGDLGWETPRVLDSMESTPELYIDRIGQIHAPSWSRGRVVLLGDAAYCASPISGMGTSLSLTGAYVLAGELTGRGGVGAALTAFEERLTPYVRKAQKLPPGAPRIANPSSRLGVRALRTGLRLAARARAQRLFTPPADAFRLPDYPAA